MDGITPEERLRAHSLVHDLMLHEIWVHVLGRMDEPLEEAEAIERDMVDRIERILSVVGGRDAEFTQHVAIAGMEGMWATIKAELASLQAPTGLRLRRRPGAPADGSPPAPEE